MLILRSYRDYPLAFAHGKGRAFLSTAETAEYDRLEGDPTKGGWLLSRIATKEMVQRFCDHKHGFVPEIGDVSLEKSIGEGFNIVIAERDHGPHQPLRAAVDTSDQFVVSCLRPAEPGETFSVSVERVESRYPFVELGSLTEDERNQIRFASPEEADRVLHGIFALKSAFMKIGEGGPIDVRSLSLRGECEIKTGSEKKVYGGCWYFDHHVMAIAFEWRPPHPGPVPGARVEEEPVLPESRHSEMTL